MVLQHVCYTQHYLLSDHEGDALIQVTLPTKHFDQAISIALPRNTWAGHDLGIQDKMRVGKPWVMQQIQLRRTAARFRQCYLREDALPQLCNDVAPLGSATLD